MISVLILSIMIVSSSLFILIAHITKNKTIKVFKKEENLSLFIFKIVSIILFLIYMPHLFSGDFAMRFVRKSGILTQRWTGDKYLESYQMGVFIQSLKWLFVLNFSSIVLEPFMNTKGSNVYIGVFGSIICILIAIFFKNVTYSIIGSYDYSNWRIILFVIILTLVSIISIYKLYEFITTKTEEKLINRLLDGLLFLVIYLMAFMPINYTQAAFGLIIEEAESFTVTHRILIYICFIYMFVSYFLLRNKPYETRRYFLVMLSLSGFIQYFSCNFLKSTFAQLPLHLCNTAIVLMFFSFAFKIESIFYFTYLVNVLGAFFAVFVSSTSQSLFLYDSISYWYNHTYASTLPIIAVALGLFKKPNFKMIGKAIFFFSIYVVFATFVDGWFNNSPSINPNNIEVDFFFLYSGFMIDKFPWAAPLKSVVLDIPFFGETIRLYPHFQGAIYIVFIGLMFVIWGIYTVFFKISDNHKELLRRRKLEQIDKLNLLKELDGRSIKSPLHPEGVNMIKINNFSKTYAGSTVKAVDNINLEIKEGEVFGFVGHNGAGKSTTIKSLVGIQTISEGSIDIEGFDISKQPLEAKLNIGYVSDNHAVYEKLTGREYVSYVADLYMVSENDKNERLEKYAKMFDLTDALDREIKSYSHGMKQKIMVISALIHNPKVWVLDEPLTGLDPTSAYQIKKCMREHADNGNIVFFSSHVIEVVEKICDRIAIISHGKIRKVATIKELNKEGVSLEELYLSYQNKAD